MQQETIPNKYSELQASKRAWGQEAEGVSSYKFFFLFFFFYHFNMEKRK